MSNMSTLTLIHLITFIRITKSQIHVYIFFSYGVKWSDLIHNIAETTFYIVNITNSIMIVLCKDTTRCCRHESNLKWRVMYFTL